MLGIISSVGNIKTNRVVNSDVEIEVASEPEKMLFVSSNNSMRCCRCCISFSSTCCDSRLFCFLGCLSLMDSIYLCFYPCKCICSTSNIRVDLAAHSASISRSLVSPFTNRQPNNRNKTKTTPSDQVNSIPEHSPANPSTNAKSSTNPLVRIREVVESSSSSSSGSGSDISAVSYHGQPSTAQKKNTYIGDDDEELEIEIDTNTSDRPDHNTGDEFKESVRNPVSATNPINHSHQHYDANKTPFAKEKNKHHEGNIQEGKDRNRKVSLTQLDIGLEGEGMLENSKDEIVPKNEELAETQIRENHTNQQSPGPISVSVPASGKENEGSGFESDDIPISMEDTVNDADIGPTSSSDPSPEWSNKISDNIVAVASTVQKPLLSPRSQEVVLSRGEEGKSSGEGRERSKEGRSSEDSHNGADSTTNDAGNTEDSLDLEDERGPQRHPDRQEGSGSPEDGAQGYVLATAPRVDEGDDAHWSPYGPRPQHLIGNLPPVQASFLLSDQTSGLNELGSRHRESLIVQVMRINEGGASREGEGSEGSESGEGDDEFDFEVRTGRHIWWGKSSTLLYQPNIAEFIAADLEEEEEGKGEGGEGDREAASEPRSDTSSVTDEVEATREGSEDLSDQPSPGQSARVEEQEGSSAGVEDEVVNIDFETVSNTAFNRKIGYMR